ncbi:A/G-specific adenine glycosylase [Patescibacteria group bacterium]|nr:MAG: A/G-specific adenine glycosylase [Patescibacteria group bacterium]
MPPPDRPIIAKRVLAWYRRHGRMLPWRGETDPYRILVSEVMLQQTQVDRVIPFYERFLERFPTVEALAGASAADVIRLWGGLGYNRRALFLQKTAQAVVARGGWPKDVDGLQELPGVGPYTSRALAVFAFGARLSVLDVNVRRWVQRVVFGPEWGRAAKDDAALQDAADALVPRGSYDWNQAIMDFGSAVCTAKRPACVSCPLATVCKARPAIERKGMEITASRRKKVVPFKESQRYVRGLVLMLLRERPSLAVPALLTSLQQRDRGITELRVVKALTGLAADGLISMERGRIKLP